MNEKTEEMIKQFYQANFLDGDDCKNQGITLSGECGYDIAKFFYELGQEDVGKKVI